MWLVWPPATVTGGIDFGSTTLNKQLGVFKRCCSRPWTASNLDLVLDVSASPGALRRQSPVHTDVGGVGSLHLEMGRSVGGSSAAADC